MKLLVFLTVFVSLVACNNASKNTDSVSDSAMVQNPSSVSSDTLEQGCYSYIYGRDTASLQAEVHGPHVTGSLKYKFFEKDQNDGTFEGEVKNGVLSGWYLFRSEGIMSVRQVAWQVRGNRLLQGSGNEVQRGDTMLFSNPSGVVFDTLRPFVKVPCVI